MSVAFHPPVSRPARTCGPGCIAIKDRPREERNRIQHLESNTIFFRDRWEEKRTEAAWKAYDDAVLAYESAVYG